MSVLGIFVVLLFFPSTFNVFCKSHRTFVVVLGLIRSETISNHHFLCFSLGHHTLCLICRLVLPGQKKH